jgi:hypothetical protein
MIELFVCQEPAAASDFAFHADIGTFLVPANKNSRIILNAVSGENQQCFLWLPA